MKKIILKILPKFLVNFYRFLRAKITILINQNTLRGNKTEYLEIYNKTLIKKYKVVDEFLKDKLRDDKFIDELALTTQISIKGSEPNYQHGKIIYGLLGDYFKTLRNKDLNYTFVDIGTAKGFSAIIMSRFILNCSLKADVHTFDIIGHDKKKYWNSILDVERGKLSRRDFLKPYEKYLKNIIFHKGLTKDVFSKISLKRIHFAFIDGSHEYDDVSFEYNFIKSKQEKGDIIFFDDVTPKFHGIVRLIDEIEKLSLYGIKKIKSSEFRTYAIAERLK